MPTITREAERALIEVGQERVYRINRLLRDMRAIRQIASNAHEQGIYEGAVIWREALAKIIELSEMAMKK